VIFLRLDEADRMFYPGFEPHITRMIQNTWQDRHTVLSSATFPWQVEMLGRKVLIKPIEIQVGRRSVRLKPNFCNDHSAIQRGP
jgi:ATP-dependent RNA helicase DDX46/PRP5